MKFPRRAVFSINEIRTNHPVDPGPNHLRPNKSQAQHHPAHERRPGMGRNGLPRTSAAAHVRAGCDGRARTSDGSFLCGGPCLLTDPGECTHGSQQRPEGRFQRRSADADDRDHDRPVAARCGIRHGTFRTTGCIVAVIAIRHLKQYSHGTQPSF
jgi:hypothetical protein